MIIVTGASGNVGRELVRLLAAAGLPVRALSRRARPAWSRDSSEWQQVEPSDRAALAGAMAGGEKLFLLTANGADLVRLEKSAIRAAVEAGIAAVVKLSALGASDHSRSLIGLWHYNAERELRSAGVPWTILRPHQYMQNFLDPLVYDRLAGRVRSAAGDGAIPFIDTRDIAAVASRVLAEADAHAGQTYTLTGCEALSYAEATDRIGRTIDRNLTHESESLDEAWQRRRTAGQPTWLVAAQLALAEYQRAGGASAATTDSVERLTGRAPRSIEEFAADHAPALRD